MNSLCLLGKIIWLFKGILSSPVHTANLNLTLKVFPEVQSYNTVRLEIVRSKVMEDKGTFWEESTLVV